MPIDRGLGMLRPHQKKGTRDVYIYKYIKRYPFKTYNEEQLSTEKNEDEEHESFCSVFCRVHT